MLLDLTVFLVLLGSACVKAARKMMVKLTLGFYDVSIFTLVNANSFHEFVIKGIIRQQFDYAKV